MLHSLFSDLLIVHVVTYYLRGNLSFWWLLTVLVVTYCFVVTYCVVVTNCLCSYLLFVWLLIVRVIKCCSCGYLLFLLIFIIHVVIN